MLMVGVVLTVLASQTPDPATWLLNYGVAGVVITLLVLGRLRTKSEVDGLKEQIVQLHTDLNAERAANAALMNQMTNHTLPQMAALADVLDRVPSVVAKQPETDLEHVLAQIAASLARLEAPTRNPGESA